MAFAMRMNCSAAMPVFREYLDQLEQVGAGRLVDQTDKAIDKNDALIITGMQNDFIPKDEYNQNGARMPTSEAADIIPLIEKLARRFADADGVVVASRDYHPAGHVSFAENGGSYLTHCVQGTPGSYFYEPIGNVLQQLLLAGKRVDIVFKGLHQDVESFGNFPYSEVPPEDRGDEFSFNRHAEWGSSTPVDWTGSQLLRCSGLDFDGVIDVNAPPDVGSNSGKPLASHLRERGVKRVFVCGLTLGLCVLDTALNAVKAGFTEVFIILDASRPHHLRGLGSIGSGFMNDPEPIKNKLERAQVKLLSVAACVPSFTPETILPMTNYAPGKGLFPKCVGPFRLTDCEVNVRLDLANGQWEASPNRDMRSRINFLILTLSKNDIIPSSTSSPKYPITVCAGTRQAMKLPASAVSFKWCNPISELGSLPQTMMAWFPTSCAAAAFMLLGGFVYLDKDDNVVAEKCLSQGKGLDFAGGQTWPSEYSKGLVGRWAAVSLPFLRSRGAVQFCWINPGETIKVDGLAPWQVPAPHGAFVYLYSDDLEKADPRNQFYPALAQDDGEAQTTEKRGYGSLPA